MMDDSMIEIPLDHVLSSQESLVILNQDKIVSKLKNHFAEFFANKGLMPKKGILEVPGAFWNDTIYVELEKKVLKFYTTGE